MTRRDTHRLAVAHALNMTMPRMLRAAGLPSNQCVMASRLARDVAILRGHRARCVPVNVEGQLDGEPRVRCGWRELAPGDEDHYPGHLVAVIDDRLAIDTTAHQFTIPGHFQAIPIVFPINRDWLRGDALLAANFDTGHSLHYHVRIGDTSWTQDHSDMDARARLSYRQVAAMLDDWIAPVVREFMLSPELMDAIPNLPPA